MIPKPIHKLTLPDLNALLGNVRVIPTDEDLMIARHTWRLTKDDGTVRNRKRDMRSRHKGARAA